MKKGKLAILLAIASVIAGGMIITSQKKNIFTNGAQQRKQLSTKEKQLAYLKEHEKDMTDFVKSLTPKVDSGTVWKLVRLEMGHLKAVVIC